MTLPPVSPTGCQVRESVCELVCVWVHVIADVWICESICMCAQACVCMLFINVHTCLPNIWHHLSV